MSGVARPTGNRYAVHMTNTTAPAPEVKRTSSILNNIPGEAPEGLRWALRDDLGAFTLYLTSEITPYGEWEEWERDDRVCDGRQTLTVDPQPYYYHYLFHESNKSKVTDDLDQARYDFEVKGEVGVEYVQTLKQVRNYAPAHLFRKPDVSEHTYVEGVTEATATMKGYIRKRRRPYREFRYEHRFRDIADLRETLVVAARTLVARHETRNV